MMKRLIAAAAMSLAAATAAQADHAAAEVEAKIYEHFRLWNERNVDAIFQRILSPDGAGPFTSPDVLRQFFSSLDAQDFDHSDILGSDACLLNADTALVQVRYNRRRTSGELLGPAEQSTLYVFNRTDLGWRANELIPFDPGARLDCSSPPSLGAEAPVEDQVVSKMREYLNLWNSHNVEAILARVYRMENSPIGTPEGLRNNFDSLTGQGYDYSREIRLQPCILADGSALVRFNFTRYLTSGEVMGPRERTSHYALTRFEDGWRITSFASAQVVEGSGCNFS